MLLRLVNVMNLKIAILVLGHNHKDMLKDMFDSVLAQEYRDYKIIYIDNASLDGSADYVGNHYPLVTVISNKENLGYAGGYDVVIRDVFDQGFDAAVLLNPDTVADKDWLVELVKSAYTAPDIALVQSKVLIWNNGPTDDINTFGNKVHFLGFGYCGHYKEKDTFSNDLDVTYASGSSLLIKKEYYPAKISFDPDFFAYLEDQDLGWQARLRGLRSVASARSIVWHKYDFQKKQLDNFKFYLLERNRLFFLTKFWSFRLQLLILPAFIIMEIGVLLDSIQKGYFIRKLKTYWDYFLAIPKLYQKRKQIQQCRTVTDSELFCYLSSSIDFEEVDSPLLRIANCSMKKYYAIIQRFI
jgi:GT2 family glycosyltransferase